MSSVAVLSDVHGVLPVLEAVLAEPDVRAPKLIVVTGDHAAGPMPAARAEVFAELDPAVRTVVCGHTHLPFARLVDRWLVINSGSVGRPYGRAGGTWALLRHGQVSLRHTRSTSTPPLPS